MTAAACCTPFSLIAPATTAHTQSDEGEAAASAAAPQPGEQRAAEARLLLLKSRTRLAPGGGGGSGSVQLRVAVQPTLLAGCGGDGNGGSVGGNGWPAATAAAAAEAACQRCVVEAEAQCEAAAATRDAGSQALPGDAAGPAAAGPSSSWQRASRERSGGGGGWAASGRPGVPLPAGARPDELRRLGGFLATAAAAAEAELRRRPPAQAGQRQQPLEGASISGGAAAGVISAGGRAVRWAPLAASHRAVAACFPCDGRSELCVALRPRGRRRVPAPAHTLLPDLPPGCGALAVWQTDGWAAGKQHHQQQHDDGIPPIALLVSESVPAACCYGAGAACARVVVAAADDGALCAWDLREAPEAAALTTPSPGSSTGGLRPAFLQPAFTSAAAALKDGAAAALAAGPEPPVAVCAVAPAAGSEQSAAGGACSLVVLGAWGAVTVWCLRRLPAPEAAAAEAASAGMRAGGRLVLIRTQDCVALGPDAAFKWWRHPALRRPGTSTAAAAAAAVARAPVAATCLALAPGGDAGPQLLAGSACGRVLRGSPAGAPPPPRVYLPHEARRPGLARQQQQQQQTSDAAPAAGGDQLFSRGDGGSGGSASSAGCDGPVGPAVTSVAALQQQPQTRAGGAFLAAHADGGVALHALGRAEAARVWRAAGAPVAGVRWLPGRAGAAFLALTAAGRLLAFDLTRGTESPVAELQLQVAPGARCRSLEVSFGGGSSNTWHNSSTAALAVVLSDGAVQWHVVSPWLAAPRDEDEGAVEALLLQF